MSRHLLADKDPAARTASCSICGPVTIVANGPDKWLCETKRREVSQSYRRQNPEQVAASRQKKSDHKLTEVDGQYRCPIDGLVDIVAIGRGWMCAVRAAELGRSPGGKPTPRCSLCGFFSTIARPVGGDGVCSLCRGDEVEAELTRSLTPTYDDLAVMARHFEVELSDDGLGESMPDAGDGWLAHTNDFDPYEDDEGWDYANPNLKTLGPPLAADDPWMNDLKEQRLRAKRARERRWT